MSFLGMIKYYKKNSIVSLHPVQYISKYKEIRFKPREPLY